MMEETALPTASGTQVTPLTIDAKTGGPDKIPKSVALSLGEQVFAISSMLRRPKKAVSLTSICSVDYKRDDTDLGGSLDTLPNQKYALDNSNLVSKLPVGNEINVRHLTYSQNIPDASKRHRIHEAYQRYIRRLPNGTTGPVACCCLQAFRHDSISFS